MVYMYLQYCNEINVKVINIIIFISVRYFE